MGLKDSKQLLQDLEELKSKVKVGDKYSHYKYPDNLYTIISLGFIEASEESCVVYQAEYGDKLVWVRTEKEFFSKAKLGNGKEVARFTKVG
ncbi:MAG TPA: DUF1653 domain-containing protein [Patescibacteria group bacterium]|nr:DUF1653 domain-containing protein [Patescibacteria group bacterium]